MPNKGVYSSAKTKQRYEDIEGERETYASILKEKQTFFIILSEDGHGGSPQEALEIVEVQQSIKTKRRMRLKKENLHAEDEEDEEESNKGKCTSVKQTAIEDGVERAHWERRK